MTDNNPLNNTLALKLNSLESRLASLERARQPYISDWREITEPSTGDATSKIITFTSTDFDATRVFSLGNRVKLKQGGSYLYFFVVRVYLNTITVDGGTDYTLSTAAVTDLGFSTSPSPIGFPTWISVASGLSAKNGSGSAISVGTMSYKYRADGDIVYALPNLSFDNLNSTTNLIQFSAPIQLAANGLQMVGSQIVESGSSVHEVCYADDAWNYANGSNGYTAIHRVDGTNFAALEAFGFRSLLIYRLIS